MTPQRIMIIGRPGGGKSTFAIKLHKILTIPVFHLDKIFYTDHWAQQNYQTFLDMQQQWINHPAWIIDGNSTKSYELRYRMADICLYFNFPKYLCFWRVFKRLFYKHPAIDDRAENCQETIRWNLLEYMWGFEHRVTPQLNQLKIKYPAVQFIELRNNKDIRRFEQSLQGCTIP